MPTAFLPTGLRRQHPGSRLFSDADYRKQRTFFAGHPHLTPTPVRNLPGLAAVLGVGRLSVKDETDRFGLPAFKGLGVTFALDAMQSSGMLTGVTTLACASEGNHGRAVARAARLAGFAARVYLGERVAAARADAIAGEGAQIERIPGTYDDAVRQAAADAAHHGWLLLSDTSSAGYEDVPRLIMLGYTRLMDEADFAVAGHERPDLIVVPAGVGGLAGAVASWVDWRYGAERPLVVAVEPLEAACLQAAARTGHPTPLRGPLSTIMGGLRCGEVSAVAFEALRGIVDAYIAIEDDWTKQAMVLFAHPRPGDPFLAIGPSGAAGVGAVLALTRAPELAPAANALSIGHGTHVFTIATEGPTEPELWEQVTGLRLE
jgi:diaminopropionate ammonia-lyase